MNSATLRPRRLSTVEAHEVLDEMTLYLPDQNRVVALNLSARVVWELCDGMRTIAQISQLLANELQATNTPAPLDLLTDVETAVFQFHALGSMELQTEVIHEE